MKVMRAAKFLGKFALTNYKGKLSRETKYHEILVHPIVLLSAKFLERGNKPKPKVRFEWTKIRLVQRNFVF